MNSVAIFHAVFGVWLPYPHLREATSHNANKHYESIVPYHKVISKRITAGPKWLCPFKPICFTCPQNSDENVDISF